jgi:type IV pilus assembly protein PilB
MHVPETELKEFIADSGLVGKKDLADAVKEALEIEQPLGDILVSRGVISEDALRRVQAYVLGIPFVNLQGLQLHNDVFSLIPEPIARTHNIMAFRKDADALEVAMLAIEDLASIDAVRKKTGLKILPRLTDSKSITSALKQYQHFLKETFGDIITAEVSKIKSENDVRKLAEDVPIVRIVDTLLRHALAQGASDIHIEPMEEALLVRYRIQGTLRDALTLPKHALMGIVARIKALANMNLDEERLPQEGRFLMETEADKVSFRVSILPTLLGEKAVLRLLREPNGKGFTLEALGFHGENAERIHKALNHLTGIILVSGPVKSGKTTTLYTMLDIVNRPDIHIGTIEDRIEYQMKRVNQTEGNPSIGLTLTSGLRALLRQDPDVIMVGDIRDHETAVLAMHAAHGRLVLAGISAEYPVEALERMLGFGVLPTMLASNVRIVIGHRTAGFHEVLSPSSAFRDILLRGGTRKALEKQVREESAL